MENISLKNELKRKGWSYRKAAKVLGCHFVHLSYVCNGQRKSLSLSRRIFELPNAPIAKKAKK